jgi:uncharacterized OsmC-like protein/fermentation-respiration switch protein FrsA (DUF1100 family)
MKSTRITFPNAEGLELAARLELPEDEKPIAYALFAHCFTCTKNLKAAVSISHALSRRKIAVLRFDFTGLGESEGDFSETTFSSDVSDLVAAAQFLEKKYEAPRLLIGHSLGGTAVLQAAVEIPSTAAVATIAAPSRPSHVLRLLGGSENEIDRRGEATVRIADRDFTVKKRFLDDLKAQKPEEALRAFKAALLVMHSPRDRIVSIDNAADIYKAARHPKSFVSLDPADHLLSDPEDSLYAGSIIATWADRYLRAGEKPQAPPEPRDHRITVRTGKKGFYTEIFANGFSLVADEPESYGGTGRGPSPYEYLMAALGSCTAMTVQMYARRKKWPLEEAVVRLSHAKVHAEDCRDCDEKDCKIDRFERELDLQGDLDDDQRQRLIEISEKCPVHRTLMEEVEIATTLRKG